jgi:hypothetical protein
MRLSAHVIDKDPVQFSSQMIGRLLLHQYIQRSGSLSPKQPIGRAHPGFVHSKRR